MQRTFHSLALLIVFTGGAVAQIDPDLPRLPAPVIVAERLADRLVKLDAESGEIVDHALDPEVALDHFLFYYSAGWSPTCQKFTPALIQFYNEKRAAGAKFEIVFVSFDDSEEEMEEYITSAKMPWPALRFGAIEIAPAAARDDDEDGEDAKAKEDNPLDFVRRAAGRGVPCIAVMDSRGLILAHSYRRRRDYLGAEKPLEEFAKILGEVAEERAEEARPASEGDGE